MNTFVQKNSRFVDGNLVIDWEKEPEATVYIPETSETYECFVKIVGDDVYFIGAEQEQGQWQLDWVASPEDVMSTNFIFVKGE